ncbi:bacterioferritin [Wolbachia endosymbiont of Diaphorina citri]|jgi:bacterioferritin|uniref:bacterioferritin n=1 Tax=Wolbachia endosymbiont of Diaphorina citri TaxID=116598 RepID=UPI00030C69B9|nr:bacterioferritin [Wolbachia endosymbiont of Diaphorina citri]QJT94010.1 bacterioferritin [Wolbachia endosymbiont of Diaphorina citri]QJT95251.1 bacterioferritin [Wolbachia endosymbiont of Diaphorina citri]QJT96497.1 bacterioferritin [Wolbachia endosymbiont of Diaphorina citri]QLK10907.1 bacterioferritin [Wolbachia endosymbiont of Diaphorina citri]QXY86577.1 bacterioferritin [Wolbachia endosymbiont of Diaphorina citri]
MNKEIVEHLNKLLTHELTSVRQYLLHSAILKNSGINKLAEKMRKELNEELEHANRLAERILLLKGMPNFQDTNKISKYEGKFTKDTMQKILEDNSNLEEEGIKGIKEAISVAEKEKDFVSVMLLEGLLKNEEEHLHWIKEQVDLIELMGIENYLRTQI